MPPTSEPSSGSFLVLDEGRGRGQVWGVDLTRREALALRHLVARRGWSHVAKVVVSGQATDATVESAREHFARLGRRGATDPSETFVPIDASHVPLGAEPPRPLRIHLVSRDNGAGLSTDMELLDRFLSARGHDVVRVDWQSPAMRRCDVALFLELWNPSLATFATSVVGIFNLEWFQPAWLSSLSRIDQVWAKSGEAHRVLSRCNLPSTYTGFTSKATHDASVAREHRALHLRGHSSQKGTDAVLAAWRAHPDLPPLTIVSSRPLDAPPWVDLRAGRCDEAELRRLMNACRFHICPSETEGWGHSIAEALSAGAVVVATDASPMNEHVRPEWGMLVPATSRATSLIQRHSVDGEDLARAVRELAATPAAVLDEMGTRARAHMAQRRETFERMALALLSQCALQRPPRAISRGGRAIGRNKRGMSMSSRGVVVVPCWRRPDFLGATLERIRRARNADENFFVFALDRGFDPAAVAVIDEFARSGFRIGVRRHAHAYRGNSYNVLEGLRFALDVASKERADLVHLVEEDVFVALDYFEFHRQAHAICPDAFAVSACRNHNATPPSGSSPHAVYRHRSYQSLGVSFRPEMVRRILAHATPAYYRNPVAYCRRTFPTSNVPRGNVERDGLIHRCVEASNSATVYPFVPRAFHAGFVGYNRSGGRPLEGPLAQRRDALLKMTAAELNERADPRFQDIEPADLDLVSRTPGLSEEIDPFTTPIEEAHAPAERVEPVVPAGVEPSLAVPIITTYVHHVLESLARIQKPRRYLEIGTREGCSLRRVLPCGSIEIATLCDTWGREYGGTGRKGHRHIEELLASLGYRGQVEFLDGDSKVTVAAIPRDRRYDLIFVDGDHSYDGAMADLQNVWPLLESGGLLVFDDVCHPTHMYLKECFEKFVGALGDQLACQIMDLRFPHGAAIAFRK